MYPELETAMAAIVQTGYDHDVIVAVVEQAYLYGRRQQLENDAAKLDKAIESAQREVNKCLPSMG